MSKQHIAAQMFRQAAETMMREFDGFEKDIPHPGEKGGLRERRVTEFLLKYLPRRYALGTGHIIDRHGKISNQTDIVIYDALNGLSLPCDKDYSLFPCECVYATIEVKTELNFSESGKKVNRGDIFSCAEGTTKLKELDRGLIPPIISCVFAYTTQWKTQQIKQVASKFYICGKKYDLKIPELVLVLEDPGFALCWYPMSIHPDRYSHIYENNPLMFFLADLVDRMSKVQIVMPNIWYTYDDWLRNDTIARIIQSEAYDKLLRNSDESI